MYSFKSCDFVLNFETLKQKKTTTAAPFPVVTIIFLVLYIGGR